jgi:hypothetical protein
MVDPDRRRDWSFMEDGTFALLSQIDDMRLCPTPNATHFPSLPPPPPPPPPPIVLWVSPQITLLLQATAEDLAADSDWVLWPSTQVACRIGGDGKVGRAITEGKAFATLSTGIPTGYPVYGARFDGRDYTRGCHWFPRLLT